MALTGCLTKTNVSETLVHDVGITLNVPNDYTFKKFLLCFYKKMGFLDESGDRNFDKIRGVLSDFEPEDVEVIVGACEHISGENDIESVYLLTKCIFSNIRTIIKLFYKYFVVSLKLFHKMYIYVHNLVIKLYKSMVKFEKNFNK